MSIPAVKVAISADFLSAFSKIPKPQQSKVMKFVEEFKENPQSSAINYEKIHNVKDSKFRSVRIDQAYRGIIVKPDEGNVYVLLWVDHHDEAYAWAEKRTCKINPETGSLQIYSVDEQDLVIKKDKQEKVEGLFDEIRTKQLLRLGVPEELVDLVRSISTDVELEKLESKLPQEAFEALYMLAAGFSLQDVFNELDKKDEDVVVDLNDYVKAIDQVDSKRRFYVIENELEMEAILNAPLEKWRVFLHPSQRRLVDKDWNGPVRVLGGAGTGKTVVAMHRAKWLASKGERILFTTFTKNLAKDIESNLGKICSPELMKKIEVVNIDQWVSDFLKKNGYDYKIVYDKETEKYWQGVLTLANTQNNLSEEFYREEWEKVIQAQGIRSLNEYLKASRVGRGIQLNRKLRKEVWSVFEEYIRRLKENHLKEREDAIRDCRHILEQNPNAISYFSVIVDEAQDMGMEAFKLIRTIIPEERVNDIFIVGDAHQKIYSNKVVLSQCGINIRGRSRKLRINYRTTEEIRKWSVAILEGVKVDDLDGSEDDQKGYRSLLHGSEPIVKEFKSFEEEVAFISAFLNSAEVNTDEKLKSTCLVVRTNNLVDKYKEALEKEGVSSYKISRSSAEDRKRPGVRIATMHRVKGLEFDNVIIAGLDDGSALLLKKANKSEDSVIKREYEQIERSLIHVSATRAKRQLFITSPRKLSPLLSKN
ncbi:MAG: hypothetical protein RLZZ361_742 [Cyanobacteriota bacterium]|jgi:mRNA-degrading endonuclease RelE of RelBE toxin-antitoxin system